MDGVENTMAKNTNVVPIYFFLQVGKQSAWVGQTLYLRNKKTVVVVHVTDIFLKGGTGVFVKQAVREKR